jgi:hypothetical protein
MNCLNRKARFLAVGYIWTSIFIVILVILPLRAFIAPISFFSSVVSSFSVKEFEAFVVGLGAASIMAFLFGDFAYRKIVKNPTSVVWPGITLALIVYAIGCAAAFLTYTCIDKSRPLFTPGAFASLICAGIPFGAIMAIIGGVQFSKRVKKLTPEG